MKSKRTKEQVDALSKRLGLVSLLLFIPSLMIMNYGAISSNKGVFALSLLLAMVAAVVGGWAIKVKTGTLLMGLLGTALLYVGAAVIFIISVLLTS